MTAGPPPDGLEILPGLVLRHAVGRDHKAAMRRQHPGLRRGWNPTGAGRKGETPGRIAIRDLRISPPREIAG